MNVYSQAVRRGTLVGSGLCFPSRFFWDFVFFLFFFIFFYCIFYYFFSYKNKAVWLLGTVAQLVRASL